MRSILFFIDTIYGNIFGCNYLRKKATFAFFFVQLGNLDSILKKLKKKDDPHSWFIFELTYSENRG